MVAGRLLALSEEFSSSIKLNCSCAIVLHKYDDCEALLQHQIKYLTDKIKVIFTLSKDHEDASWTAQRFEA